MTQVLRELGTAGSAEYFDYLHEMPKRYFHQGEPLEALNVSGSAVKDSILAGVSACHACVIACGRVVRLEDGAKRKGPEYETLIGFGPNLALNDPAIVTRLGELCDRYGMDSISASNTIALAFRLYELGIIDFSVTGGLELAWGDAAAVEQLLHLTAHREGFGAHLAEGALALARRFGVEDEAVQVNGLEAPYHDPRGASGMALVYATSPRGACHNQSDYFLVDFGQVEASLGMQLFDRHAGAEKAANVAIHQKVVRLVVAGAARRGGIDQRHAGGAARVVIGHLQVVYLDGFILRSETPRQGKRPLGQVGAEALPVGGQVD